MRRGTGATFLAALALAGLGGCGNEGEEESVAADQSASCEEGAAETLAAFDDALQTADVEALSAAWRPNHFKWFSLTRAKAGGGRRHFVADQPAAAIRYVERNGGLPIEFAGLDPSGRTTRTRSSIGFAIEAGRWRNARELVGKAQVACDEGWIKIMSLAVPPRSQLGG